MDEKLLGMPKVELHLHLDGSIRVDTAYDLLDDLDITIDDVRAKMIAPTKCKDLNEYLNYFDLPQKVLQKEENLTRVTRELIEDLEKENVVYAEIRFAPMFHTKEGLTQEQVVQAVLNGMKDSKIKVNLILCCMRGFPYDYNFETIETAYKFYKKGVCALDLAGSEIDHPKEDYNLFDVIRGFGMEYTVHAGETNGPDLIKESVTMGAKRIGHGLSAIKDQSLMKELKEKEVILEMCPTSNIQTNAIDDIKNHPIYDLFINGVLTTINTDNRTVSNTTLTNEYRLLLNTFPLSIEDIKIMNLNGVKRAFISEEEKKELYSIIDKYK